MDGGDRRHLVLCGTEGTIHVQPLDKPSVRLTLSKPRDKYPKGTTEIPFGEYPRYAADMADTGPDHPRRKGSDFPYSHELTVLETVLRRRNAARCVSSRAALCIALGELKDVTRAFFNRQRSRGEPRGVSCEIAARGRGAELPGPRSARHLSRSARR